MINQILKDYTESRPEDIFINYNNQNITYSDMAYAVEGRIKSMQAINIQREDLVGIYLGNSLNLLEVLFACIEVQAHPLIIPSSFTSKEIENLNSAINISYFITDWDKSKNIKIKEVPVFAIEELSPGIGGCAPSLQYKPNNNQIACMLLTSGTTGNPKIAQISVQNIIESCKSWDARISFKKDDIYLNCLPLHHIGGLSIIFRSLLYGFKIILVDEFKEDDCINKIIQHKVSLISLVPTMLSRLLKAKQIIDIHKILRVIILSGSYCSTSLLQDAINKKLNIYKAYGMTESSSGISGFWVKDNLEYIESVGTPHNNINFKIKNNHILVKGPAIIGSYYNGEKFDNWYNTYDTGYINSDGFLYVFGREGQAISGGENIDILEIKNIIASHPDVKDVFIQTIKDEEWGEKMVAYINSKTIDKDKLKKWLKTLISNHKIPKEFIFINRDN